MNVERKNPSVEFTANDRCDRCIGRAVAAANKDGMELLFCRHHIRQHNVALEASGWTMSFDYVELEKITPPQYHAVPV